jgi:hypothetical protein
MELVPEPGGFRNGVFSFNCEEIKHRRLIVGCKRGQVRRLLAHEECDGACIESVRLVPLFGTASAQRRPARVHLVHRFALADERLGEPAPVAPRSLDPDLSLRTERRHPAGEVAPAPAAVGALPRGNLVSGVIDCMCHMHALVCVHPDSDHSASSAATVRAAPGLTWLSSVSNRLLSSQAREPSERTTG